MLGDELKHARQMDISKSSFLAEQADEKKLKEIIEERDQTIRKLSKKINQLETSLKKAAQTKNHAEKDRHALSDDNNYYEMLKVQVNKTRQLEDIIKSMTSRINLILEDMAHDNSFTDNSEELRHFLQELELQNNLSVSLEGFDNSFNNSFSLSKEWVRILDILEGTIRVFRIKGNSFKQESKMLADRLADSNKRLQELNDKYESNEQLRNLRQQLKEERKQREKLRNLLDQTQYAKNEILNRIQTIGFRDIEVKAKTKEQLLQYSKELNYRVKDLEKQKKDILKETNKDKEAELKKYQDVLKKLRTIKETSRMGKSYA